MKLEGYRLQQQRPFFLFLDEFQLQYLAVNNGNLTKYNALGQASGLDDKTVRNYPEILEETFLIKVIRPWFTNRNHEIVKLLTPYGLDVIAGLIT